MTPLAIDETGLMVGLSDRVWGGLWDGLRGGLLDVYEVTITNEEDI
jgi:hypothetical protein